MSDLLKILPILTTEQLTRIAASYTQDLAKLESNANWYHIATLVSVAVATIGYQSSQPIEEKEEGSKTWKNRLLRTCFIYGSLATAYFFFRSIQTINKIDHLENMHRFCIQLLPTQIEGS